MKIARELLDQLVEHVLEDPANEICGIVAVESDGSAPGERQGDAALQRATRAVRSRQASIHTTTVRLARFHAVVDRLRLG